MSAPGLEPFFLFFEDPFQCVLNAWLCERWRDGTDAPCLQPTVCMLRLRKLFIALRPFLCAMFIKHCKISKAFQISRIGFGVDPALFVRFCFSCAAYIVHCVCVFYTAEYEHGLWLNYMRWSHTIEEIHVYLSFEELQSYDTHLNFFCSNTRNVPVPMLVWMNPLHYKYGKPVRIILACPYMMISCAKWSSDQHQSSITPACVLDQQMMLNPRHCNPKMSVSHAPSSCIPSMLHNLIRFT